MNGKNDGSCRCDEIINLQRLTFEKVDTDDGRLTYRAEVSPVFALTLSTELPEDDGRKQAEEEFRILRTELLAAFILTAPRPDDGEFSGDSDADDNSAAGNDPGSDPDEFREILMVPGVDESIVTVDYGAVVVVQAPIPTVVYVKKPRPIKVGWKHIWTANQGTTQATVSSIAETEVVDPGRVRIKVGDDPKTVKSDTTVTIFNYGPNRGKYEISAGWKGPKRKIIHHHGG